MPIRAEPKYVKQTYKQTTLHALANPTPAITNTYHYKPTHLSHYPPLPPLNMMTGSNGGGVSVVGGGGEGSNGWQL